MRRTLRPPLQHFRVPLKQSFAVTGSMDQNGEVQPIGGVNQKIEGFFDLCKMRGLNGSNGVIIPEAEQEEPHAQGRIVEAVREGKFSIYTIDKMEEGLEILTGMTAGELKEDGTYPEGTINYLVTRDSRRYRRAWRKRGKKRVKTSSPRRPPRINRLFSL